MTEQTQPDTELDPTATSQTEPSSAIETTASAGERSIASGPASPEPPAAGKTRPTDPPAGDAPEPRQPAVSQAPAAAASGEPEVDPQEAMDAAKWGRVDGEGRVYVQDKGAEREVGQFPDAPFAEARAFYVRRFLDLNATVDLFAPRLPQLSIW